MGDDARSRRVVFVAHCLLNQNAKVEGLATYPGAVEPLIAQLLDAGVGFVQMPCPEAALLGLTRPLGSDTREQYDTHDYRETCRKIAARVVEEIAAYRASGYRVCCILGVEGSPSCAVACVPRLRGKGERVLEPGEGIFVEALRRELDRAGIDVPMLGIPEVEEAGDLDAALGRVARATQAAV
jgi:predicted secreted protein